MTIQEKHVYEIPNESDSKLAEEGSKALLAYSEENDRGAMRIIFKGKELTVPSKAIDMFADILQQMAQGNAVSIISVQAELTTQQAADLLNISRPFLIKNILDVGKLAFHKAGNRRKVYFKDLLAYQQIQKQKSEEVLSELAGLSQKLGIME